MKTNSWKCYVFCFLFTVAHSKNRMQIESNWIARKTTRNARFQQRERIRERERALVRVRCKQNVHNTNINSLQLGKAAWRNEKLMKKRSIIALDHNTKARTLKAAHAHSHSQPQPQPHPHIRAHIRTRCGARGAERATKTSVENRIDWASFALTLYTSSSLSPASAIASMCAKKLRETDSWCFSHLFAVFFYTLLGLSSLPGGRAEQHPATADEGESEWTCVATITLRW